MPFRSIFRFNGNRIKESMIPGDPDASMMYNFEADVYSLFNNPHPGTIPWMVEDITNAFHDYSTAISERGVWVSYNYESRWQPENTDVMYLIYKNNAISPSTENLLKSCHFGNHYFYLYSENDLTGEYRYGYGFHYSDHGSGTSAHLAYLSSIDYQQNVPYDLHVSNFKTNNNFNWSDNGLGIELSSEIILDKNEEPAINYLVNSLCYNINQQEYTFIGFKQMKRWDDSGYFFAVTFDEYDSNPDVTVHNHFIHTSGPIRSNPSRHLKQHRSYDVDLRYSIGYGPGFEPNYDSSWYIPNYRITWTVPGGVDLITIPGSKPFYALYVQEPNNGNNGNNSIFYGYNINSFSNSIQINNIPFPYNARDSSANSIVYYTVYKNSSDLPNNQTFKHHSQFKPYHDLPPQSYEFIWTYIFPDSSVPLYTNINSNSFKLYFENLTYNCNLFYIQKSEQLQYINFPISNSEIIFSDQTNINVYNSINLIFFGKNSYSQRPFTYHSQFIPYHDLLEFEPDVKWSLDFELGLGDDMSSLKFILDINHNSLNTLYIRDTSGNYIHFGTFSNNCQFYSSPYHTGRLTEFSSVETKNIEYYILSQENSISETYRYQSEFHPYNDCDSFTASSYTFQYEYTLDSLSDQQNMFYIKFNVHVNSFQHSSNIYFIDDTNFGTSRLLENVTMHTGINHELESNNLDKKFTIFTKDDLLNIPNKGDITFHPYNSLNSIADLYPIDNSIRFTLNFEESKNKTIDKAVVRIIFEEISDNYIVFLKTKTHEYIYYQKNNKYPDSYYIDTKPNEPLLQYSPTDDNSIQLILLFNSNSQTYRYSSNIFTYENITENKDLMPTDWTLQFPNVNSNLDETIIVSVNSLDDSKEYIVYTAGGNANYSSNVSFDDSPGNSLYSLKDYNVNSYYKLNNTATIQYVVFSRYYGDFNSCERNYYSISQADNLNNSNSIIHSDSISIKYYTYPDFLKNIDYYVIFKDDLGFSSNCVCVFMSNNSTNYSDNFICRGVYDNGINANSFIDNSYPNRSPIEVDITGAYSKLYFLYKPSKYKQPYSYNFIFHPYDYLTELDINVNQVSITNSAILDANIDPNKHIEEQIYPKYHITIANYINNNNSVEIYHKLTGENDQQYKRTTYSGNSIVLGGDNYNLYNHSNNSIDIIFFIDTGSETLRYHSVVDLSDIKETYIDQKNIVSSDHLTWYIHDPIEYQWTTKGL